MYEYIGPKYNKGLLIPGLPGIQRPAEWTAEEIAAFQKKDPARFAKWFKAGKGKKTETLKDANNK